MADEPDRRKFLKLTTCGIGAGVGLVVRVPVLRAVLHAADKQTVTTPKDPIDLGTVQRLKVGAPWKKLDVVAPVVRDAWTTAHNVVLCAACVRRPSESKIEALSGVCPHLGCSIEWDGKSFLCPCHQSAWKDNGELDHGKAKRALDPLPIAVVDGRLRLTWVRYKLDTSDREPV